MASYDDVAESQGALIEIFERLRRASSLPPTVIARLASEAALQLTAANQTLFREGQLFPKLLVVVSGRVALEMNVPGRGRVRILTLGPADLVAWSSVLGSGRMTTTAISVVDGAVAAIPAERLLSLCERDAEFGQHVMRWMAQALSNRLVATRLQLLDLFAAHPGSVEVVEEEETA
jgi:CRP/FNR family transcriptional regulator, cyclic AMP receptor protein